MKAIAACMLGLAMTVSSLARAGDSPDSKKDDTVAIQLGKVSVKGREQVLRALQAIKIGLHTPISGSKKDRNKIVCRIHSEVGSHTQQILTCAPNWLLTRQRMETQTEIMAVEGSSPNPNGVPADMEAQEVLQSISSAQPGNELNMRVTSRFLPFLDKLPDLAPSPATVTSPVKSGP